MLIALLLPPALAGKMLDLRVTEPLGTPLWDIHVAAPFHEEKELELGADSFRVVVDAQPDPEDPEGPLELAVVVYRLDGPLAVPTRVAGPLLTLEDASWERVSLDVVASKPVVGPSGEDLTTLRWQVEALWSSEVDPAWLVEVRNRPIEAELYVLAWSDAPLFATPESGAEVGRLRPVGPRTLDAGAVTAWQVIEDRGAWVQVRNLQPRRSRQHCFGGSAALSDLELSVWVRRDDLVLTTRTSAVMDYSDGTGTALASGVPLVPVPGEVLFGHPALNGLAHGVRFSIGLPAAPLGLGYEPLASPIARDRALVLDVRTGEAIGKTGAGPIVRAGGSGALYVTPYSAAETDPAVVLVGGACAEHRVAVPAAKLMPAETALGEDIQLGGSAAATGQGMSLPVGAIASWPGGGAAGVVLRPRTLLVAGREEGDRVCADLVADAAVQTGGVPEAGAGVRVCFDR